MQEASRGPSSVSKISCVVRAQIDGFRDHRITLVLYSRSTQRIRLEHRDRDKLLSLADASQIRRRWRRWTFLLATDTGKACREKAA